jgi:hypothetical protein
MDEQRFDRLTRALAAAKPWDVFKGLAKGLVRRLRAVGDLGAEELCGNDLPTADSLDAARAALHGGANEVALSPGGCVRYRRTFSNSNLTHEEMTFQGKTALVWDHITAQSKGQMDADLDGFFEWQATVVPGASIADSRREIVEYAPSTHALTRRETYTRQGEQFIHVVQEEADSAGSLSKVREFDARRYQPAAAMDPSSGGGGTSPCSAAQEALIRNLLREAMNIGLVCLHRYKALDKEKRLTWAYATRDVTVLCTSDPDAPVAMNDVVDWFADYQNITIIINWPKFGPMPVDDQREVLFHEILHELGLHDYNLITTPDPNVANRLTEIDPTHACDTLCFGMLVVPHVIITKCHCATCLGTNICDPRCKDLADCNPELAAKCPCKVGSHAGQYFSTCKECMAKCPSGLGCFFINHCDLFDVSCVDKKKTCP